MRGKKISENSDQHDTDEKYQADYCASVFAEIGPEFGNEGHPADRPGIQGITS
jgi:hypothetical protein